MITSLSEKPITFRAEEVHACPAFEPGQQVSLLGRCVIQSATTGLCAYMMANIRPLIEALESGMSAAEIGVDLNGGIFRCSDFGCSSTFRVNIYQGEFSEESEESRPDVDSIMQDFHQPQPSSRRPLPASSSIKQNTFNGTPFLRRLDIALARDLVNRATHKTYQGGETIITEGSESKALYIIHEGQAEILKNNGNGSPVLHATIGPAECFGEFPLFTNQPSKESVRTLGKCSIWSIPGDIFQEVMTNNQPLHRNFSRVFAQRIKYTGMRLSEYLTLGVTGSLAMLHAIELLQALFLSERTGTLFLARQDGSKGCIYFDDGKILFAACDKFQGRRAFFGMLPWSNGNFWFEEKARNLPRNLTGDTVALLLEAEREFDRALQAIGN